MRFKKKWFFGSKITLLWYRMSVNQHWTGSNEIKHSKALVKTYKISVLLNSLFRNIKENQCLDALEESDDEEEFENISLDKYVDLNKKYIMKCEYNFSFKKW